MFERAENRLDVVAGQLGLSSDFLETYLATNNLRGPFDAASSYEEFLDALPALMKMYASFALSTVQRGEEIYRLVQAEMGHAPKGDYLDIGCGYGGFVRSFARRGVRSTGVELVPQLAEYSRQNCHGLHEARIVEGSFLSIDPATLGSYDCITCNDVIEHIQDPPETIRRISKMLRPGGLLIMEIPNRSCLHWLPSDGHFQLFGISCLTRDTAGQYFREVLSRDDYFGHMGEFYDSGVYLELLGQNGLRPRLIESHSVGPLEDLPGYALRALKALEEFGSSPGVEKLHPITRRTVQAEVAATISLALRDWAEAVRTGVHEATARKYMQTFWTIAAAKA